MEIKNITEENSKPFEPIVVELTITSIEELAYLCALFNLSLTDLLRSGAAGPYPEAKRFNLGKAKIWEFFRNLYQERRGGKE